MEIGRDIADLLIGHRHRGHAFIRPAATDDFAYLVTLHVMRNERRADQVRPSSAGAIGPMTESAGLLELFVAALDCWILRISLRPSHGIPWTDHKDYGYPKTCRYGQTSS